MGFTVKESPFPLLKTSFLDMSSSSSSFEEAKQYHEEEGLMIFHLQECIDYKDEINDLSPTWTEDDVKDSLLPYLNHGQQQEGGKIREDQNDSLVSEEELFEMLLLVSTSDLLSQYLSLSLPPRFVS